MSLQTEVKIGESGRYHFPLIPTKSALLIIDVQNHFSKPIDKTDAKNRAYFFEDALPSAIRNIRKIAEAFRVLRDDEETPTHTGCEVIFTYVQTMTNDGRDMSLDYKLSGPKFATLPNCNASDDEIFLDILKPTRKGKGDLLVPKTSCSVFNSTNLNYILRNLGVEQLLVVGQLTNQCVESAVRDAADLGYFVTVAQDACAAEDPEDHLRGLEGMKGFCRIVETVQVLDELVMNLGKKLMEARTRFLTELETYEDDEDDLDDAKVLMYLREKGMLSEADYLRKALVRKKSMGK